MLIPAIVSASLALVAVVMMIAHVKSWKRTARRERDPVELRFGMAQLQRRMKASGLLIVLAMAIVAGHALEDPWWVIGYWAGLLLLVVWICLLALADLKATQQHYGRVRSIQMVEQARLEAELRQHRARQENGHPHDDLV